MEKSHSLRLDWSVILLFAIDKFTIVQMLGVLTTLLVLSTSALVRCILNRASVSRVERVREHVEKLIIHGQTNDTNSQLITPMLGGYLDSGDSSRCTTATHSRNSSEGVTPHYAVLNKGQLRRCSWNRLLVVLFQWTRIRQVNLMKKTLNRLYKAKPVTQTLSWSVVRCIVTRYSPPPLHTSLCNSSRIEKLVLSFGRGKLRSLYAFFA